MRSHENQRRSQNPGASIIRDTLIEQSQYSEKQCSKLCMCSNMDSQLVGGKLLSAVSYLFLVFSLQLGPGITKSVATPLVKTGL